MRKQKAKSKRQKAKVVNEVEREKGGGSWRIPSGFGGCWLLQRS